MEAIPSSFTRPQKSAHENNLFRNVSRFKILAHSTGGLKSLYDCIKFGASHSSKADHAYTDSYGRFVPGQDVMLVNRYHVLSCIETSGQSAVLVEAEDCFQKMLQVVIKVMNTSYLAVGLKEVETLRKMNSADPRNISHTIRLLNSFRFDDHICLVFPALNPMPLTGIIAEKFLHEDEILPVIRKISFHLLSALAFLRSQNIIHADIKPENILLKKDGGIETVTLIDFGNAIHHVHSEVSPYYIDFELQTQPYRAPEVHLGNPFSVEVDMWSLGCVLLELLSEQIIFFGNNRADSLKKMVSALGPLPVDMCRRGKFYSEVEPVVSMTQTASNTESGALRLMSAFPCIKNYEFASFLSALLTYHPDKRMTPWEALQHPFMAPVICIPHFLTDAALDTGVIKKSDYSFKQNISTNVQRLYPSTFDLLRAGTSDPLSFEYSNVALVEPLGLASRLEEEDTSQQHECENKHYNMQHSDGTILSSYKREETHRPVKHISPDVHAREIFKQVKYGSFEQTAFVTAMPTQPCNISSDWNKSQFTHRFKQDRLSEIFKNEPKTVVIPGGHSVEFRPSHRNTSDYRLSKQPSSHGGLSQSRPMDQIHLSNDHNAASDNNVNHELILPKENPKNVKCQMLNISEAGEYKGPSAVKNDTTRASQQSGIYTKDQNSCSTSADILEKMCQPESRDTAYYRNSSDISLKGSMSPLRNKQNESPLSYSQIFTQDKFSEVLPNRDYLVRSVTKDVPRTAEQYSRAGHSFSTRSMLDECHSPVGTQRCSYMQKYKEHEYADIEPIIHETLYEKTGRKNAVSYDSCGFSTDGQPAVAEEAHPEKKYQQDQILCESKATLHSPYGDMHIKSFSQQLRLAAMDKQEDCLEKTRFDESDRFYKNCPRESDQIDTSCHSASAVTTCPISLEKDQERVLSDSEDESTKVDKEGSSLLNTTQEYPALEHELPDHFTKLSSSTVSNEGRKLYTEHYDRRQSDHQKHSCQQTSVSAVLSSLHSKGVDKKACNSEVKRVLPPKVELVNADNCSQIPSTEEYRNFDKLVDVQKSDKVQSQMTLHNLTCAFNISPVVNDTSKRSPATIDHDRLSTLVLTVGQDEGPVIVQDENTELPVVFGNKAGLQKISRKEHLVDMCIMENCSHKCKDFTVMRLPASETGRSKSETKRETLSGKAKAHEMKKLHCPSSDARLEMNNLETQLQDSFLGQIDAKLECNKTSCIQTPQTQSRPAVSYIKQRISMLHPDKFSYSGPSRVFTPKSFCSKHSDIEQEHDKSSKHPGHGDTKEIDIKCRKGSKLKTSCFNAGSCIQDAEKNEFGGEIEYQNQAERRAAFLPVRRKFGMIKQQREVNYVRESVKLSMVSMGNGKSKAEKRKNAESISKTTREQHFHTNYQKKLDMLQTDASADQVIEKGLDKTKVSIVDNLSSLLVDASAISKPNLAERGGMLPNTADRVLNGKFRLCFTGKDLHHDLDDSGLAIVQPEPQNVQQRYLSGKPADASRLLRAKSVKRALSFHTEKSPRIYDKRKSAKFRVQRSLQNSKFPAQSLKTETGLAVCSRANGSDLKLSDFKSSGSSKKTNHQFLHLLSTTVNDQTSFDPYEFKVTPAKLQHSTDNFMPRPRQARTKRRSKSSAPRSHVTKKKKDSLMVDSEVSALTGIVISDLVEKKSRHMFQDVNSPISKHKMRPLDSFSCKSPLRKEENMKNLVQVASEVEMAQNDQHGLILDSLLTVTGEEKAVSRHRSIKTPALPEQQTREVSETLDAILTSARCSPDDKKKLPSTSNLSSNQNIVLETTQVFSSDTVTSQKKIGSHCVTSGNLSLEKTISQKRKFILKDEVEEPTVILEPVLSQSLRLDNSESAKHYCSTFDLASSPSLKQVSAAGCLDEENYSDEEILLLD